MDAPAKDPTTAPVRRKLELPWLVLAAVFVSTLYTAYQSSQQLTNDTKARFNDIAQSEQRAIARNLHDMEDLMFGASALTSTMPVLSQATWDAFFDVRMPIPDDYAGLVALQYVPRTTPPKRAASANLTHVFSPSRPSQFHVNWDGVPEIADAMARASVTRKPVLSRSLGQIAGLPELNAGVAFVLAVNPEPRTGPPATSTPQTGGHLIGIVDLNSLMAGAGGARYYPVMLELFDGERKAYASPEMQATHATPAYSVDTLINTGQRQLRLRVSSAPALENTLRNNTPRAILMIGVLSAAVLAGLIWLLTRVREQAEALAASMTRKLQDQTKFTEDLIEFNPNPIFRKDAEGRFVSVNRAWEQLSGRNRKDILGKTYREFQEPGVAARNEEFDRKLLASPSGYEVAEAFITNADEKQFETIIAKQVLRGSDGRVDGLIGTITDVTPIKHLERELALQREQLDLVIRSSQQGIWDVELKAGGATYFSERFQEILRYEPRTFPSPFDWEDAIHPDDRGDFRRQMLRHFRKQTPLFDVESRVRGRDGSYIWVRTRAIAQHGPDGRAVRFVGSISDVTERKLAERALLEANVRVTEAARAKEAFLATMSHEIRTPLNGVLGMTSLLAGTELDDEQRDYIRLIRASGDTLLRLIDDVLDFSKIESGHMTLESVRVEIVPMVEEAFELVAEKAREKQLALLFDMHQEVPFYVLGDATRFRQILLNLLSNAIKFTERGEIALTMTARPRDDGRLVIEGRIRDTGIGIPAGRAQQLFQPFTQVDASTTRKYGGTGLGLAICKRLTELMGGDIRVESVEGEGSTFIFTILTQRTQGPSKPYMQENVEEFRGKRLLVVDRNATRRSILQARYSRWGFETVTVAPADAVKTFRAGPRFDLLLTDMVLPTAESLAMQAALEVDDAGRERAGLPPIVSILQSSVSRAELAQRRLVPPLRHDVFVVRPAGRARLFDVLMRAVLREPNHDIATRPFASEPAYERDFVAGAHTPSPARAASLAGVKSPAGGRSLKVLVAEDNEVNQRVILGMLKNLGHECSVVGDGQAAANRAIAGHFDVILMDVQMPELDGVAAMREIRAHLAPDRCPPIAAMTAHALSGDREHYLAAGMDDYISKPIRPADLALLLGRLMKDTDMPPAAAGDNPPVTATRGADGPIHDTEQLEDLRYLPATPGDSGDNDNAAGGLIRLFQAKSVERLELMQDMLARADWHQLAETAHSLRGSSATMGLPRVANACKDLELAARRMQAPEASDRPAPSDLPPLLARIELNYAESNAALTEWLAQPAT